MPLDLAGFPPDFVPSPFHRRVMEAKDPIAQLAKELSERHRAELESVRAVLDRLRGAGWLDEDPFAGDLDLAMAVMGADDGVHYFEAADLAALEHRIAMVGFLDQPRTPLCSLAELASRIDRLVGSLIANRDSLVSTGFARFPLDEDAWPDCAFTCLYPVKQPRLVIPLRVPSSGVELTFDWPSLPPEPPPGHHGPVSGFFRCDDGTVRLHDGTLVESRPYDQAPCIPGVTPADATRVESLRLGFHDATRAVLLECQRALQHGDAATLWSSSLAILSHALKEEDVHFLARLDRFFRGHDARVKAPDDSEPLLSCGGLSELLGVVGHVEEELTIGLMAGAQRALMPFTEEGAPEVHHYFHAFRTHAAVLDAALDGFAAREPRVHEFWESYRRRLSRAFDEEFLVGVTTHVRRKDVLAFQVVANRHAVLLEARNNATTFDQEQATPVARVDGSAPSLAPTNVFRRDGETWKIVFKGLSIPAFPHVVGFAYIAVLLQMPRKEWTASNLMLAAQGSATSVMSTARTHHQAVAEDLPVTNELTHDRDFTKSDAHAFQKGLAEIDELILEAQDRHDVEGVEALRMQKGEIQKLLRANTTSSGKAKSLFETSVKPRDAVRKGVQLAIDRVRAKNPELGAHLGTFIKTASRCCYESDTVWEVQLS